jgi:hypothetical protein
MTRPDRSSESKRTPYEAPRAVPVRLDPTRELLQSTACGQDNPDIASCDPDRGGVLAQ